LIGSRLRAGGLALLVVASMLVGGLITVQLFDDGDPSTATPAVTAAADETASPTQSVVQTADDQAPSDSSVVGFSTIENLPDLVESVIDSVVYIELNGGAGTGTGVVLDTDGHIVTNYHVVESASDIVVRLHDGSAARAVVLGVDPSSDLAVIQADFDPAVLHPATFGDSESMRVGDSVFAIGNPFTQEWTVTAGIISGIDRGTESGFTGRQILGVIQTDAPVNPGNSGGPLFDANGDVIGINTSIEGPPGFRGNVGLGFAVPSNTVLRYLPAMLAGEDVVHTQLGVTGGPVNEVVASDLGLAVDRGFLVGTPVAGAAQAAGIQPGDVITTIGGVEIFSFTDLAVQIDGYEVGDQVTIELNRNGDELEVVATLQAWTGQ
jgi:putative serine protease PepD